MSQSLKKLTLILISLGFLSLSACSPFGSGPFPGPDKQGIGTVAGAALGAGSGAVWGAQVSAGTGP